MIKFLEHVLTHFLIRKFFLSTITLVMWNIALIKQIILPDDIMLIRGISINCVDRKDTLG